MPHTSGNRKNSSRKKNQYQHSKRVQVEDSDGWTHVVPFKSDVSKETPFLDRLRPAEPPDGETLESVKTRFEQHRTRFLSSSCWQSLQNFLKAEIAPHSPKITSCVCVALGSPSGTHRRGSVDHRTTTMNQLAALLAILGLIGSILGKAIPVYAQDPVFNDLDRQLLQSVGMTVLENPQAFEKIEEETLLYCPGAEIRHLLHGVMRNPAALVGGPLDPIKTNDRWNDGLDSYVQGNFMIPFPYFEESPYDFWKMEVYIKRSEQNPAAFQDEDQSTGKPASKALISDY